ncbi:UDP-N-acetylmuramoyl-L-alanine--D-glutamate ligase [Candidatus Uhrbacteria bacterium]|nr:UDP-N-acetylmuramoyl-L-alanine--D-glutamate ligase [Candidatus Uhrbacteria bacterium]
MKFSELEGKKILILGYGKEGKSTEIVLRAKLKNPQIAIADQSDGPDYLAKQKDCDIVIKTPGIPLRDVTAPHTTATNLFFGNIANKIIGVTGSKGKSTTSSLIQAILQEAGIKSRLIGNIGKPALDVLLEPIDPAEIFVMELSSYQLEDIGYSPHIGVITSIFREHLDHHGSFEAYFEAKARMILKATPEDFYVYNPAYPELAALAPRTKAKSVAYIDSIPFDTSRIKLEGAHNQENVRGALTVARLLGISDQVAARAVEKFEPLPHRLTFVGDFKGIKFYDDAIATAPEPTIFAIQTLKDVDTIFLGGTDRGYDFSGLVKTLNVSGIRNLVLFPETGERIAKALEDFGGGDFNILKTESMQEAVAFAYANTAPGKICLLSTASPSYTLWKNFEEKGDEFVKWVKELGGL